MCLYLFLLLNLFLTANCEVKRSLEERYIELLPDGDKLAFLGKVARRIQEEVNTDVKPNKPDLSLEDKDLKPHSEYVNKVLKEEAIKFVDQNTRRELNETSNDDSQIEQSSGNGDDKRTTSEDLTLREINREEVVTTKVLSEHEIDSKINDTEVNEVVTDSKIDADYVNNINITVPVTDLLLTENNETTTVEELATSTIKDIRLNVDESKIEEEIPKQLNQRVNTDTLSKVPSKEIKNLNLYRTKLDNSNEYLSNKDETVNPEERLSKKKDLSRQFYQQSLTGEAIYFTPHEMKEIKNIMANEDDDDRTSKGHEVYEIGVCCYIIYI